jgi:hypothetical protein
VRPVHAQHPSPHVARLLGRREGARDARFAARAPLPAAYAPTCGCSSSRRSITARTWPTRSCAAALFAASATRDRQARARHRDIVARFGRFPHRNAVLGRDSTAEELEYLKTAEAIRAVAVARSYPALRLNASSVADCRACGLFEERC